MGRWVRMGEEVSVGRGERKNEVRVRRGNDDEKGEKRDKGGGENG